MVQDASIHQETDDAALMNRNLRMAPDAPHDPHPPHHKPHKHPQEQPAAASISPPPPADETRLLFTSAPASPFSSMQGVQQLCQKEIVTFCSPEVAAAWSAHESSTNPDDVRAALRTVNLCLARNSKLLSPDCFAALVQLFQLPPTPSVLPPFPTPSNAAMQTFGGASGTNHNSDHRKHHRHGDDDNDDSDDDWRYGHRSGTHPIVWVLVLPFFFFGLFVASKKGVKYAKAWHKSFLQRRELAGGEERNSEDYAPLKVQEPS